MPTQSMKRLQVSSGSDPRIMINDQYCQTSSSAAFSLFGIIKFTTAFRLNVPHHPQSYSVNPRNHCIVVLGSIN